MHLHQSPGRPAGGDRSSGRGTLLIKCRKKFLNRAQRYGFGFEEYKKWVDEKSVVIAQIEHIDGVNNIEEIIQTEGIDGILIGPYDLSGSLGIPGNYNQPIVKEALMKVEEVCLAHKKSMGYHVVEP
ncbi:MAG: hypothetical protein KAU50_10540, partial [Candidatus Marinimicrobia bacterium]|nr:hypothetical protein [Candidatus Neomarinimicrobiota bacterium]